MWSQLLWSLKASLFVMLRTRSWKPFANKLHIPSKSITTVTQISKQIFFFKHIFQENISLPIFHMIKSSLWSMQWISFMRWLMWFLQMDGQLKLSAPWSYPKWSFRLYGRTALLFFSYLILTKPLLKSYQLWVWKT